MLRQESAEPGFWSDPNRARETGRRLAGHETLIAAFDGLARRLEDAEVLLGLADEGGADAAEAVAEASEELRAAEAILGELELSSLYFGEYDHYPAILGIHAGAGGVDAQDWAEMLLRMYQRYLSDRNYRWQLIQITPGEEAGIKSATLTVRGEKAYGNLESERGVHRLVRISPFDAQSRRHTSFAGVDVAPEMGEEATVEVNDEDLRIDTYRSHGRRRTACEHHRLGGADHPSSHRSGGAVPERAFPVAEPVAGHGHSPLPIGRVGPPGAPGGVGRHPGRAGGGGLGSTNQVLCPPTLPVVQGHPHGTGDRRCSEGAQWGYPAAGGVLSAVAAGRS